MPVTLTRAQGFPKVSERPDQGLEIEDRVYAVGASYTDFKAALPKIGDMMADIEDTAKLIKYGPIESLDTNGMWFANLTYATPSKAFVYSVEHSPYEQAIEKKTTAGGGTAFKTNWKYRLAGLDVTSAVPSWWSSATNTVITSPDEQVWRWVSDPAELPTEPDGTRWGIKSERTKPGIEAFIVGSVVIRAASWYSSFADAKAAAQVLAGIVGKRFVPTETFGYPNADTNWLCVGLDVAPDGYYWSLVIRYQYSAEGWDTDIYPKFV